MGNVTVEGSVTETVAVAVAPDGGHASPPSVIDFSGPLVLLTWFTFLLTAFILYKLAWKPILSAVEARENSIRRSLENAKQARAETAELEARKRSIVKDAEAERDRIIAQARTAASVTAESIRRKAEDDAERIIGETARQIESAEEQARVRLRAESADLVVALAGKIVGANMDSTANRALVKKAAGELA